MTNDMTIGSPMKLLMAFTWPVLAGNVLQVCYMLVDAIIVGKWLGPVALSAVGSVSAVVFVIIGFVFGLTAGTSVVTAQRFGAKDSRGVRLSVGTGVWVCAAFTILITILCVLLTDSILRWQNTPPDVFPLASNYLRASFYGIACIVFFNFQSATLRALGDSRTPLWFLAGASILNVGLDILFIRVFGWGVASAAWATNLSIFVSAVACFLCVTRRLPEIQLRRSDWRPRPMMARKQLVISIPMGLQFSITGFGAMVLQTAINTFGVTLMAGLTAAEKLPAIAVQIPVALGQAMATYSAQNFGAGKLLRIREGVRASVIIVTVSCLIVSAVAIFFGRNFIGLFISMTDPSAGEIIAHGQRILTIAAPFFIPLGWIFVFRNTLQGVGHSILPMIAGGAEMVMRIGVSTKCVALFGIQAIYWADPSAWIGACLILIPAYLFYARQWKHDCRPEEYP
ncbi:MAG: MATE family efflux transporter [Kiritimatiellia bacterium]